MSKTAFDRVTSNGALYDAWKRLFRRTRPKSRNTEGVDGRSINDFALDENGNLAALGSALHRGRFAFHRLRPYFLLKPDGKYRLICVPTVEDRIVQGALLHYLSGKYGRRFRNEISYGFLEGRGVKEAVALACVFRAKHPWVFRTDITSFFDRIPRDQVMASVRNVIRQSTLHDLLGGVIDSEVQGETRAVVKRIQSLGIVEGVGLRQGMPLSPFLSNLFLESFDRAIVRANLRAVRYADDLIFFADSESECREILLFCRESLSSLQLEVPDTGEGSKSEIFPPAVPAEFLGLGLCPVDGRYELRLLPAQIERIRQDLLMFGSIPELLSRKIRLTHLERIIDARVSGYLSAYDCCTNHSELQNALENVQQKVLRRIYADGLQIRISSLSAEARTFLGLKSN